MKFKKVILIISIFVVIVFIVGAAVVSNMEKNLEELTSVEIENVDLSKVKDGTYTGSYGAMPVTAKVEVTVDNHEITVIKLVEHNNGKGKAAEAIIQKVTDAQNLDVGIVSGATYSSKVILKAIEIALKSGLIK